MIQRLTGPNTAAQVPAYHSMAWDIAIRRRLANVQKASAQPEWLERELPNLCATAQVCYRRADWPDLMALRDALWPLLDRRGDWDQALQLNQWALEAAQAIGDWQNLARWTHDCADLRNQRGEYQAAVEQYTASAAAFGHLGKPELELRSRHMLAMVLRAQGRVSEAEALGRSVLADAKALALGPWLAHPLYLLGLLARDRGAFMKANRYVEDSLALVTATGELAMQAQCQHFLGELAVLQGQRGEARAWLERSLALSRQLGICRREIATERLLGDLAQADGRLVDAATFYRQALDVATRLGDQPQLGRLFLSQARLASAQNHLDQAHHWLDSARLIYETIGDQRGFAATLFFLAALAVRRRHARLAIQLFIHSLRAAESAGLLRPALMFGLLRRQLR